MKCFPVCYYHFCEEKGRAAEQDFSTADLERCWLILKPSWMTAFYNFFFFFLNLLWLLGPLYLESVLDFWITGNKWCKIWPLMYFFFSWLCWLYSWFKAEIRSFAYCIFVFMHIYVYITCTVLLDAIMCWTRLFCYWNLLRFLFRK